MPSPFDSIKDPLVREYMERRMANQDDVDEAKDDARNLNIAAGIGDIAGAFVTKASGSSVPYFNRWQDMGQAPKMANVEGVKVNMDPLRQAGKTKVQEAKEEAAQDDKDFWDEQKIAQYDETRTDKAKERALTERKNDPNSAESKQAREYLRQVAPNATNMAGFEGMTAAQIEKVAPGLMKSYSDQKDRESKAAERAETRNYQRQRDEENRAFRRETLGAKEKELSATQMKKQGLADIGEEAEGQYQTALQKGKDSGDYDPTSSLEFLDNSSWVPNWMKSNASIEARGSQDSWIDSYLRDESGAAIPADERDSYREIYFPQPGDTPQAVANKERLRKQKMQNARAASGSKAPTKPAGGVMHGADLPD